ncbi:MAG TPA: hypothetical protein VGI82_06055 [Chitinophagaceae bacterium]|jgi:hypothetical protein
MPLFSFSKKVTGPYKESSTNLIYQLLFCDNIELYKENTTKPHSYPFDILFSANHTPADLQKLIDDSSSESRIKILAYNQQLAMGYKPLKKELLAVIVEMGLDNGLDVLASFNNGTARYINQAGKMIIWETTDETFHALTNDLFLKAWDVINQIGPWDKPRRPWPAKGLVRISFLVSDGLYFGEAPINVLFNDPLAKPSLTAATALMNYLVTRTGTNLG